MYITHVSELLFLPVIWVRVSCCHLSDMQYTETPCVLFDVCWGRVCPEMCVHLLYLPVIRSLYQCMRLLTKLLMQHVFIITCLFWLLFVCWLNLLSAVERLMLRSGYFKLMPFKGFKMWDTCLSLVSRIGAG